MSGDARFSVGDTVDVLNAFRLPKVEEVRHTGTITRIEERPDGRPTLYWISGLAVARTLPVLRSARRRAPIDDLLGREFDHIHAGGVTRYRVERSHRNAGYFECVSVRAMSGGFHFVGSTQVFHRSEIVNALGVR